MDQDRQERRTQSSMSSTDHDTLIRVDTNLINLLLIVENYRKDYKSHLETDLINFKAIAVEMNNLSDDIQRKHNFVMSVILPALGGGSVIMFILNWMHH